jgi:hypothetical protein
LRRGRTIVLSGLVPSGLALSALALSAFGCNAGDAPAPGSDEDRRLVGRLVAVTFNLKPDASCEVAANGMEFLPSGLYDLAQGSEQCDQPYRMHLQVKRVRSTDVPAPGSTAAHR